ncbi:hypothetical protein CN514_18730 [Bacillus sp. AFS001701]|uniref:DUF5348 domain-containing protein n=1 Tax=Bacillus sp. AFS001701 TaxID=2033480 RepID=UPI000BF75D88|nr:DUF5348 domain-containing protein [Bacillus sp. AFS001701]PET53638.1 hypothetical protein CN514_18730 [Bacillus sp. AFS001701]
MARAANIKELQKELFELTYKIERILSMVDDQPDNIDYDPNNPDECMLYYKYRSMIDKLSDINYELNYLKRPIKEEGALYKQSNGKYTINGDYEFSSGSRIEVLVYDDLDEREEWVSTRIEHTNNDYYFFHLKETPLEGAKVRRR